MHRFIQSKPSLLDNLNQERIKFNIEIIKLLTLLFITTGGGALALVVERFDAVLERVLAIAGMIFSFTSGFLAIVVYKNTLKKLK